MQEKCWSSRLEDVKRLLPDEDLTLDAIMGVMPDDKQLASQAPFLSINGTDVEVHNSYSMKDSLRSIGFRFDAARACWVRPVEEVLTLLELPDSYSITLELLTETSKRAGATLLSSSPPPRSPPAPLSALLSSTHTVEGEIAQEKLAPHKSAAPSLKVEGDELAVYNCYEVRGGGRGGKVPDLTVRSARNFEPPASGGTPKVPSGRETCRMRCMPWVLTVRGERSEGKKLTVRIRRI